MRGRTTVKFSLLLWALGSMLLLGVDGQTMGWPLTGGNGVASPGGGSYDIDGGTGTYPALGANGRWLSLPADLAYIWGGTKT